MNSVLSCCEPAVSVSVSVQAIVWGVQFKVYSIQYAVCLLQSLNCLSLGSFHTSHRCAITAQQWAITLHGCSMVYYEKCTVYRVHCTVDQVYNKQRAVCTRAVNQLLQKSSLTAEAQTWTFVKNYFMQFRLASWTQILILIRLWKEQQWNELDRKWKWNFSISLFRGCRGRMCVKFRLASWNTYFKVWIIKRTKNKLSKQKVKVKLFNFTFQRLQRPLQTCKLDSPAAAQQPAPDSLNIWNHKNEWNG